jgi:fumarate reductase subunit D
VAWLAFGAGVVAGWISGVVVVLLIAWRVWAAAKRREHDAALLKYAAAAAVARGEK